VIDPIAVVSQLCRRVRNGEEPVTYKSVAVHDRMQKGYRYELSEPAGRNFDPEFRPELTPAEMLRLGFFSGK
jgi:hypothetical protein